MSFHGPPLAGNVWEDKSLLGERLLHEQTTFFHNGHSSLENLHHHLNRSAVFRTIAFPTPSPPNFFGVWTTSQLTNAIPFLPSSLLHRNLLCNEINFSATTFGILYKLK
ncbi:hypothetical protein AAHE18_16G059100 [Arachis hypogaea]